MGLPRSGASNLTLQRTAGSRCSPMAAERGVMRLARHRRGRGDRNLSDAGPSLFRAVARMTALRLVVMVSLILAFRSTPMVAEGQQTRTPLIGFLHLGTAATTGGRIAAFQEGLRELGYSEGRNIVVQYRRAEDIDRLGALAAELVGLKPDVIVTSGNNQVRALRQHTATIPIVVAVTSDPVAAGLADSLARPRGNVTGLAFQDADLSTKRLQLLKECLPGVLRVAVFWDGSANRATVKATEEAAKTLGLKTQLVELRPGSLERAFEEAQRGGAHALMPVGSSTFAPLRERFARLAIQQRLPTTCENRDFALAGCLMSYGPSFDDMFRRTALYVDKLLKGARASELPFEQPTKFEFVINVKAAKALRLTLSPSILARADEVIQ